MTELSVYLHIPFCERKCPYCAFTSYVASDNVKSRYLDAVERDFANWRKQLGKICAKTFYIGGGTPSCLSLKQWYRLAEIIEKYADFSKCSEFTVEANPNSLGISLLEFWKQWHVTRVSIGVQSLDDTELEFLGRLHNSAQALSAIEMTKQFAFDISADFMFGFPCGNFKLWQNTLKKAVNLGISHLSLYQLSIEENTPFSQKELNLPEGYEEYAFAQQFLPEKGFIQYEIANFAKLGKESKHNLNYWQGGEYLGIGASASGYINGERYKNQPNLEKYCNLINLGKSAITFSEKLETDARAREAAILRLRTAFGIERGRFREEFGRSNETFVINTLSQFPDELYKISEKNISLTQKGMQVANQIWTELV